MNKSMNVKAKPETKVNFSIYAAIICLSVILVVNPVVVSFITSIWPVHILYIIVFDFILAVVAILNILHVKTRRRYYFLMTLIVLAVLPFVMIITEVGLVYARVSLGLLWDHIVIEGVHRPDPMLGWSLIPNSIGRHASVGNYDVEYRIDSNGRKEIPQKTGVNRTVHFFGDSFIFGQGVSNESTALNLLADRFNGKANILNYGVMGYGLAQMFISLRSNLPNIKEGDIVIFSPASMDLERNFIYDAHYCMITVRKGYDIGKVPALRNGRWAFIQPRNECSFIETMLSLSYGLPLGTVYRLYKKAVTHQAIIQIADEIFIKAQQLTQQRGARFLIIFVTSPEECRTKTFEINLEGLKFPFSTLMQYCPTDSQALDKLKFPTDLHWSEFGNEWAAQALEKLLRHELSDS